jgi:hypothetical protein
MRVWSHGLAMAVCLVAVCGFGPERAESALDADVIVTSALEYAPLAALKGGERFPKGAQLQLIHAGKAEPLVEGFAATADAQVSFDGTRVLFAGKKAATDNWQIWEMTLKDRAVRRLIAGEGDAIRPFYLPFGRLVYARKTVRGFQIEAAGKDGASALGPIDADAGATVLRLSYLQGSAVPDDVMEDGRILFESGYPLGAGATPEMYLMYADGSGVESYRCDHGAARWGGRELASGDVVFTKGKSLARFTSPLAHEAAIAAPQAEYAGGIAETAAGDWLVSARRATGGHYALIQWKPGIAALKILLAMSGDDVVEPVVVAARERPKRHPSGLHDWSYANLVALDSRLSRAGDMKVAAKTVRLETLDADGRAVVVGSAPVYSDGSFYVRVAGDRPMRFALLDAKGTVVRAEHGWFWIRRGEQRYCVGCHTGPERSPENRVPDVLMKTTIPVDLTGAQSASDEKQAAHGSKGQ